MKQIITTFLFFWPIFAFAEDSINPEQASQILADALKIASGVPGVFGAIIVAVIMGIYAIIVISKAITTISDYFKAKKIREEEAYKEMLAAKLRQMEDQSRREMDNYLTSLNSLEEAWRAKLNKIIELIKSSRTSDVLLMVQEDRRNETSNILYDSTKTPEFRASEIIKIIRRK